MVMRGDDGHDDDDHRTFLCLNLNPAIIEGNVAGMSTVVKMEPHADHR